MLASKRSVLYSQARRQPSFRRTKKTLRSYKAPCDFDGITVNLIPANSSGFTGSRWQMKLVRNKVW